MRVKITFPDKAPLHIATILVRITDINYGGHVGNDAILGIMHEARMLMLAAYGFTEMNAGGNSLIMADVMIAYKGEAFYGDVLHVALYAEELTTLTFDLLYHITATRDGAEIEIAHCKTCMVCFNYDIRKKVAMTEELRVILEGRGEQII